MVVPSTGPAMDGSITYDAERGAEEMQAGLQAWIVIKHPRTKSESDGKETRRSGQKERCE